MSEEFIDCWHCNMPVTLAERGDNDGFCPHCMCEIDLDDYLCQSLATINQLRAELAALKAQEPVAWVHFHNGEVAYDRDYVISNEPGDSLDDSYEWRPVYATPVVSAEQQGFLMVPSKPTGAMLSAAFDRTGESEQMRTRVNLRSFNMYLAMLAAAPAPSTPEGKGDE